MVITPENFRMIRWEEHCQKGVTDGRTDEQMERNVLRAAKKSEGTHWVDLSVFSSSNMWQYPGCILNRLGPSRPDYLTGRSQYVEIDGVSSKVLSLSTGVRQGSILGPLLFLIYMNDIPYSTKYFNFILYTDDTTLSNTIQIPSMSPLNINDELAKVYDWLAVNKFSLNVKKTKYVIFHAINKKFEDVVPDLEINGIPLERVKSFNFLGLLLNENMSWKPHIDLLSNKLAQCAGVLNKLKRFLPIHILRTLL